MSSVEQLRELVSDVIRNPGAPVQNIGGPAVGEDRGTAGKIVAGVAQGNFPSSGSESAPVTIAVFSDFQCPYCARFASMMKELAPRDGVRLVFRHLPLSMHSWARPAAEAAACAQDQGAGYFWRLHDYLFEHQREITAGNLVPKLVEYSKSFSAFDQRKFADCLDRRATAARVGQDVGDHREA